MSSRPPSLSSIVDPAVAVRRREQQQRHSPGPDQIPNDLYADLIEAGDRRIQSNALRFDEATRVSQPGQGRVAEQGQIASGRVIPNNNSSSSAPPARLPSNPPVKSEVRRVWKRKRSPPPEVRPGQGRLLKEAREMGHLQPEGCHAVPKADDLYEWSATIEAPRESVYANGFYFCTIYIPPEYPFLPPKVSFHTRIYHCNVNAQGDVCLNILKDGWNATMGIQTVLQSLLSLMFQCYPEDAAVSLIARQYKTDRRQFNKMARLWTRRYAMP